MTKCIAWIAGLIVVVHGAAARAQGVTVPVASPVSHPAVTAQPAYTAGNWRHGVGQFGESLATGSLQLRGFEVWDMKLPGNQGIDLVALKRNASGTVMDVRLVEVKTHYGSIGPRLGQTRVGTQMSRQWLADRLRALRSKGEQGRQLALDVSRFRKAEGIPLERLGEVHEINLRTGKYAIRNPVSMTELAGPMSVERLLFKVSSRSPQPAFREWAIRHLSEFDRLRQTRMGTWLSASPAGRALDRVSSTQIVLFEEKQALRGARRGLIRAAGRIAIVVAVAMDAYEIYGHVREYRLGNLSKQEFMTALARSGGGIAGAWAGAAGGAWVGAQIGILGGPWAWVTVPVGGIVGGAIGGVAGYLGGSHLAGLTAETWYASLDRTVRDRVSGWLKDTATPVSN